MSAYKKQIGGSHYSRFNIQPSKFINDNKLLFAEGNAIKYICRHTHKGGKIKRTFGKGDSFKSVIEDVINVEDLRNEHGLLATGDWQQALDKITDKKKTFIIAMEKNGENISPDVDPRIKLSTIHGAKGDERQNTVLMLDIDYNSFNAYQKDPNPEHRLFFVGITRAKNKLFIMAPKTDYYYTIGDPII